MSDNYSDDYSDYVEVTTVEPKYVDAVNALIALSEAMEKVDRELSKLRRENPDDGSVINCMGHYYQASGGFSEVICDARGEIDEREF